MALVVLLPQSALPVSAGSGDRTLYLHHTHTGLTASFTFKHNGQYDQKVLQQLNVFLADWRTKEPTHMSPELFDLVWEIYQDVGGKQPVNIVSAYRSPTTNAMLRSRSSAVAEHSQHMLGHAMDIFIPGISLAKLRETAMRHQVGGVGFYPTSGSPFVHVDVGNVRAWPRMTRAQLKRVFPDGRTLHLPTDGKPLSDDGRRYAQAQWTKCHMVPCNGGSLPGLNDQSGAEVQLASLDPAQRDVQTIEITAPLPMMRPSAFNIADDAETAEDTPFNNGSDALAPIPARKSPTLMLATREALPVDDGETAVAALAALGAPIPQPRLLMTPREDQMVTAYVPATEPDPGAQLALRMLIERETTASLPARMVKPKTDPTLDPSAVRTASLGGEGALDAFKGLFNVTLGAVVKAGAAGSPQTALVAPRPAPSARAPLTGLKTHEVELVAPEIDHVTETLLTPVTMSSIHYAELYEPEGYLDDGAELGPLANRVGLEPDNAAPPPYDQFFRGPPLLVASR